jgi:hypothetical protein
VRGVSAVRRHVSYRLLATYVTKSNSSGTVVKFVDGKLTMSEVRKELAAMIASVNHLKSLQSYSIHKQFEDKTLDMIEWGNGHVTQSLDTKKPGTAVSAAPSSLNKTALVKFQWPKSMVSVSPFNEKISPLCQDKARELFKPRGVKKK